MTLRKLVLVAYFLSGASALTYEIAYTRGLILVLGTSSYAYSIMLAAFLFGMGLGSLLVKRFVDKMDPLRLFAYLEIGIGAYGLLFIPIINRLDTAYLVIFNSASGNFLLFSTLLVVLSFLLLLIPTVLMGMTFPVASKILATVDSVGRDIGLLFSVNTLGGVVGAFTAGFVLLPILGLENTILLAVVVNVTISISIFVVSTDHYKKAITYAVMASGLLVLGVVSIDTKVDSYRTGIYYDIYEYRNKDDYREFVNDQRATSKVLFSDYGLYGSVIVREAKGERYLLLNGKTDAGTGLDVPTELLLGYIPMMVHHDPKAVGIIGLGSGLTLSSVLNFDVETVDMMELNPTVVEACQFFKQDNGDALEDDRVNLVIADARNYLSTASRQYDVIISEPSNPWIEGEGFLFTKECYDIVASRLAQHGLFIQWVGTYDFEPDDFRILLRTVSSSFPYYQVWSNHTGADLFILGAKEELAFDYVQVRSYFEGNDIQSDFETIANITDRTGLFGPDLYFSFFVTDNNICDKYIVGSSLNTDNRPVIEFNTARNRVQGTRNILVDLIQHMSSDSQVVTITPDIRNIVDSSTNYLEFLELEFDNAGMESLDTQYYYRYSRPSQKQGAIDLHLELKKSIVLADGDKRLHIHAHPQVSETPRHEIERIAEIFEARVTETTTRYGPTTYRISGNGIEGMLWYCDSQHYLYIAYFSYPEDAVADHNDMERITTAVKCQ